MMSSSFANPKMRSPGSPPANIHLMPYQARRMTAKERKSREPMATNTGSFVLRRETMACWTVPMGS
jgi:hypothetical protein